MKLYLIGSLRNELVPALASEIRSKTNWEVFDDWFSAGPEADDYWKMYERNRGSTYEEALAGHAAQHVFQFDKHHLDTSDAAVLLLPAGRSGHLELGYMVGRGKPGYILLDRAYLEEGRWDVMYSFATKIFTSEKDLVNELGKLTEVQS
jgi:hypothetical protein